MSRHWVRSPVDTFCGGPCGRQIAIGEPVLKFYATAWPPRDPKIRCARCAGEPVPADLPPLVARTPIQSTSRLLPLAQVTGLPADFKRAAGGDREPGEEG